MHVSAMHDDTENSSPCLQGEVGRGFEARSAEHSEQQAPHPNPPLPSEGREQKLWFDGELINHGSLQATLSTHAMHYGSGVFEGIRAYATLHEQLAKLYDCLDVQVQPCS